MCIRDRAKIDAMHRGTIIHFALEKMIEEYGASLADMELSEIKSKSRQIIDEYIKTAVGAENLPASLSYMLDNISTLLSHVLLRIGKELSQSKFSPLACELKIGYDAGDIPPLEIALDEGRQISVTGIVDLSLIHIFFLTVSVVVLTIYRQYKREDTSAAGIAGRIYHIIKL